MSEPFGNVHDPLATVSAMMHERCDAAHCRGMIRTGSRSFYLASHLLPGELRQATYALYAFCREADDAIDGGADPFVGLSVLRRRLAGIYADGVPANPVDRALARVVRHYAMPRELLEALLQGFAWDAQERSFKDLPGVHCYSVRVAGSVGIAMALLMGVRDADMLARAADLGVAMQLTNIARDVGEDARNGRIYLPLRWLREEGIAPQEFLADPQFSAPLASVIGHLLAAAEQLYRRADSGIAGLPGQCRPGIHAARLLYSEIGHELLRRGGDSVSRRTVVPPLRKLRLMLRALRPPTVREDDLHAPPLPQVRYLLRAVDALPPVAHGGRAATASSGLERDVNWVLDLFAELERRDREASQTIVVPINRIAAFERAAGPAPRVAQTG